MNSAAEQQPESTFGREYRNERCHFARSGVKPYRRCDYCSLKTRDCLGLQNNAITAAVALLLFLFVVLDSSLLVRINIVVIVVLLLALGYKINSNLDRLARSDFLNWRLNRELKQHTTLLEEQVQARTVKLERMLSTDDLTGLINRREFEKRLQRLLDDAHLGGSHHVLCFLDLDRFKIINDSCGHAAGDELLRQLTPILLEGIRENDTVARFGGDEFAILLRNCDIDTAVRIADRMRQAVEDYRFAWNESSFGIGVSIGIIGITDHSGSMVDLLAAVDDACYRAKELGRNRVHVYEYDTDALDRRHREMQWATRIARALEENRFVLHYQPIVPVAGKGRAPRHFEVLVRMLDENGVLVPPMAFLPAAERFNLMPRIDRWVIRHALQSYRSLTAERETVLSINLSGASFTDEHLLDYIKQQMFAGGAAPEAIHFEITETAAIANLSRATALISALRELGCRFALDDFGSGLSSFGYLKHLPVDYIKIDGSFVRDMTTDLADRTMVEVINYIGHALDKKTIAEFVEDDAILEALRELGVDYAQGYGVGKPLPLDAILMESETQAQPHKR